MSAQPAPDSQTEPKVAVPTASHNLSWIAMVVMAAMCLGALIFAASLNVG